MGMRIAFINPNFSNHRSRDAMQPLAFAILKALTPPEIDTVLFDERVEEIDSDVECDAVAISVQSYTARRAYEIARRFKDRGIPVVIGGHHATLLPDEAAEHCDAVAVGNGETVWPQVVDDLLRGTLKRRYNGNEDVLPDLVPDRSVFAGKHYSIVTPVQFGSGCRYSCDFCSVNVFFRGKSYQRSIQSVLDDIDAIASRYLIFVDDNIYLNNDDTLDLFRSLPAKNRKWVCQISIDSAFNENLLKLMADAGCVAVFVGLESLNPANLKQIKKVSNIRYGDYSDAIRRFAEHGIMFCGSFLFGYDGDTIETIKASYEFAMRNRMVLAHFNTLYPMPGTPLYDRLQTEGRLRYEKWWLDPEFRYGQGMFYPKSISASDLGKTCYQMRRKFNSIGNILLRFTDRRTNSRNWENAKTFLAANFISRREIIRKQDMELGID